MSKIRKCDICESVFKELDLLYLIKAKYRWIKLFNSEIGYDIGTKLDVCFDCMNEFEKFVRTKRNLK